ncbi:MAG: methyltransferase domain-containing protein [Thermoanaerobaculales bacterium]|jgi:SAM-dependent methyltransferase|nr:methyltransferase domain-containing protein [Thermoanaerobaculales bacterium]
MTRDPVSGIRILDRTVDYADGAEDRVLEILDGAGDLGSLSDELAARIDDWPTRYHLARERSNVLRPLRLNRRHRVLEIGAGTGAVTRYLGETGATVVALEGALSRARATARRCRDLDNVEIVCGAASSFEAPEGFDLVCLVGVLEYAAVNDHGADPEAFIRSAVRHLRPGGSLVVAIENQIGLKYLVGYEEDHLGRPWVGLEGYPGGGGARTFPRRRLAAAFENAGLDHQLWFYPFPDYKHPTTVVSQRAYAEPDATSFIDQVVGSPVSPGASAPALLCDDRRVHRVLLDAGLGAETANSFLVVASAGPPAHGAEPDPGTLAWLFGNPRRSLWIRHQAVEETASGRRVRTVGPPGAIGVKVLEWLRQEPFKNEEFVHGTTVWELAAKAGRSRDETSLAEVLGEWRRTIDEQRTSACRVDATHPFLYADTRDVLPPDHLDVCPSNFVVTTDGIVYIDREWVAEPAVDADLVSVRGLWLLAQSLVFGGGIHPWDASLTVDEVTAELARLVDLPIENVLERIVAAEAELQQLVTGRDRMAIDADLAWTRTYRPTDAENLKRLPLSRLQLLNDALQSDVERARDALRSSVAELETERGERRRLESELAGERREVIRLSADLAATHELLAEVGGKLEEVAAAFKESSLEVDRLRVQEAVAEARGNRIVELETEIDEYGRRSAELEAEAAALRSWREAFERRLPVRVWRRLRPSRR